MIKKVYFITGASGTGKTTLISNFKKKHNNNKWVYLHFDIMGIPSKEEMIKKNGSIENWQKETTFIWIKEMLNKYKNKELIIFERQTNLDFIKKGFQKSKFSNYKIILIDCNEITMKKRLENRKQAELFNEEMKNWLKFLRNQAKELNIKIIKTSNKRKSKVLELFEKILKKDELLNK